MVADGGHAMLNSETRLLVPDLPIGGIEARSPGTADFVFGSEGKGDPLRSRVIGIDRGILIEPRALGVTLRIEPGRRQAQL